MKVIDLLNKIANGEYPTVKYRDVKYEYDDTYGDYIVDGEKGAFGLLRGWSLSVILNDEVEIIEEDKKIERLSHFDINASKSIKELEDSVNLLNRGITTKINEIIDYLEENKND